MSASTSGTLFVISAPSGTGKTSLLTHVSARLYSLYNYSLKRVITYTSRAVRNGEVPGRDYWFISPRDFETKIADNFFCEWSDFYGTYYGSPYSLLEELSHGTSLAIIVDRAGAQRLKAVCPHAFLIWLEPPHLEELRRRLTLRGQNTPESIAKRLALAAQELAQEKEDPRYDYSLINDDFEQAVQELIKIFTQKLGLKTVKIEGPKTAQEAL